MISYYKNQEFTLETLGDAVPNCWINVTAPSESEKQKIVDLGIPHDFLTYSLDADERPRIEQEDDDTLLIVIRVPYYLSDKADIPYITAPLGIILTDKYIVTVCSKTIPVLQHFETGKVPKLSTTKRYRFTLRLLMAATNEFLEDLKAINREVDRLEDELYNSMQNTQLISLFKLQKSFVYFTQALKQNELTLIRMTRLAGFKKFEEDEDLLQDVITENTQAIDMTNISSTILVSMMDAFASIISNNLNVVMKFLASVTIVMSIPNIISGFFGMNVEFPWLADLGHSGTLMIMVITIAVTIFAVWIFNKKDWF